MYSGVAPMGTFDSYTTRPTLDQGPMGSRLTPRWIRAAASSRRRALSVLTRSVIWGVGGQRQGERRPRGVGREWEAAPAWRARASAQRPAPGEPLPPERRAGARGCGLPLQRPASTAPTPAPPHRTPPHPLPLSHRARHLACLHELDRLCGREQPQQLVGHERVVAVVGREVTLQLGERPGKGAGAGRRGEVAGSRPLGGEGGAVSCAVAACGRGPPGLAQ